MFVVAIVGLGSWLGRQIFARPVLDGEHIIFTPGESYRLAGEMDKPLVVIAGDVTLERDSQVADDSAFIGDTITFSGQASGDLTLMGDSVTVGGHITGDATVTGMHVIVDGQVDGDLTVVSDNLTIGEDAGIGGKAVACVDSLTDARPDGQIEPCSDAETLGVLNNAIHFDAAMWGAGFSTLALFASGFASLVLSGVGALAVAVFPRQFSHIEEAILTMPRRVGQTGFLAFLLAIGVTAAVVIVLAAAPPLGLVLLPVFVIAAIVFLGMTVTGWVSVALIAGNWLLRRSSRNIAPPMIAAAVGSVLLFVLWHVLTLLPFGVLVVLLAMVVLGSVGLGAALTTRMGTRTVRRRYFVQG
jgi:hypothetical protein